MATTATTASPPARWASTPALLACGVIAGPLFLIVVLLEAVTRPGFDLGRHPVSLLSLGDMGWVQIANFVGSGLLMLGFAVGLRRVLRNSRGGTWGPLLIGLYGCGLIVAGLFVPDPGMGLPTRRSGWDSQPAQLALGPTRRRVPAGVRVDQSGVPRVRAAFVGVGGHVGSRVCGSQRDRSHCPQRLARHRRRINSLLRGRRDRLDVDHDARASDALHLTGSQRQVTLSVTPIAQVRVVLRRQLFVAARTTRCAHRPALDKTGCAQQSPARR